MLAGLDTGSLPETLADRSIIIRMRRKSREEQVDAFRVRRVEPQAEVLRERAAAWAAPDRVETAR